MRRLTRRLTTLLILGALAASLIPAPVAHAADRGVAVAGTSMRGTGDRTLRRERQERQVRVDELGGGADPGQPSPDLGPLGIQGPSDPEPDRSLAAAPSPAQATTIGDPAAAEATGFAGLAYGTAGLTDFEPPDPFVAVGPEHVVQTVNTAVRISTRDGTEVTTVSLFEFFGLDQIPGYDAYTFDPRVIYDSLQGRWLLVETGFDCLPSGDADVGTGYLDLAISDTADPTGDWTIRSIPFPDALPDYPGLGTTTDKVLLTSNVYPLVEDGGDPLGCSVDGPFLGTEIDVMAWSELKGTGEVNFVYFVGGDQFDNDYFSWRPALQQPATSVTAHLIAQDATIGAFGNVAYTRITGSPAGGGLVTMEAITDLSAADIMAPFDAPPAPAQPGSPATVADAADQRPTDAVWQDSRLTVVSTYPCDPTGGATETRACVRFAELGTSNASAPTLIQDVLVAEDGADLYMGGVGYARNGDLHVLWTRSSADGTDYPSSYAARQPVTADDGELTAPQLLAAGTGTYPGTRWGDYVGVAQDPQVPNAVWGANEYAVGGGYWATRVSQLQTGGSTFTSIAPVRVLDSRIDLGVSGIFTSSSAKDFAVAGFDGGAIPDDAVAVTGNVTVTGQTAAGYVAITTVKTNNPSTSTINVPVGDNRANNVTVPLSTAGRLSAVFKGPSGSKSHVIFDVTGYFTADDAGAGYTPLAEPVRVLDSRPGQDIGLTGPFAANTPRELSIADANGIPAEAVAITANLTVVNQTRAGYVSVTPDEDATPPTSTMNFPTGDIRANGLTADLDAEGDLWLVYVAAGGNTAHLILDVTGYYLPAAAGLAFYPLEPGRLMDTRSSVLSGLTGQFTASTPRTLATTEHWGVPDGAEAITGNLTVVGQTHAGYVAATPVADADPSTSTINFPKSDIRANGLTVPLAGDGSQAFVYKSSGGAKTHLILDLTGYFE